MGDRKPTLGVSRCLLGENVRYDGSHKRSQFVVGALSEYFDWNPVCPEIEAGMSTPRPAIRQVRIGNELRVVGPGELDVTEDLEQAAERRVAKLKRSGIRGFILKKDSPSCGMSRVRVYRNGHPTKEGVGIFAAHLMKQWPSLPVEEEGRLNDARLRENFLCRVFTYDRWQTFLESGATKAGLIEYHAAHKYLVLSHSQVAARRLGQLVANHENKSLSTVLTDYENLMMETLKKPARTGGHANTLEHILGFLKRDIHASHIADILKNIRSYRAGYIPLVAPLALLKHHLGVVNHPWMDKQLYLNPYPEQLMLRNFV